LYYFRDEQGLEVDFLLPGRSGALTLIECKTGKTVFPAMAKPMIRLNEVLKKKRRNCAGVEMFIVHQPSKSAPTMKTVFHGVKAMPWSDFFKDSQA